VKYVHTAHARIVREIAPIARMLSGEMLTAWDKPVGVAESLK
jgi:hypothetical protein